MDSPVSRTASWVKLHWSAQSWAMAAASGSQTFFKKVHTTSLQGMETKHWGTYRAHQFGHISRSGLTCLLTLSNSPTPEIVGVKNQVLFAARDPAHAIRLAASAILVWHRVDTRCVLLVQVTVSVSWCKADVNKQKPVHLVYTAAWKYVFTCLNSFLRTLARRHQAQITQSRGTCWCLFKDRLRRRGEYSKLLLVNGKWTALIKPVSIVNMVGEKARTSLTFDSELHGHLLRVTGHVVNRICVQDLWRKEYNIKTLLVSQECALTIIEPHCQK